MIASLKSGLTASRIEPLHQKFLIMLPVIRRQAYIAFRGQRPEAKEELVAEVIANAYCAFIGLARRNKLAVAFPTPLSQYAIRQVLAGRRVGSQLNKHDLLTPYARKIQGFNIERADHPSAHSGALHELLVEDRRAGPAEIAVARIDVAAWLNSLSKRQRRIAKSLATGSSTSEVAQRFGLSPARISQLRSWFRLHWENFQGEMLPSGSVA